MENTWIQAMNDYWGANLGTTLTLIHVPQFHSYYAVGWKSAKLLTGIICATHYEDCWHERVLARAQEYGLSVSSIESVDSMLRIALALDEQARQRKGIG